MYYSERAMYKSIYKSVRSFVRKYIQQLRAGKQQGTQCYMAESQLSAKFDVGSFGLFSRPKTKLEMRIVNNAWIKRMPSKEIV